MTPDPAPSREDVLDAFAVESRHDRATLDRYLRDYPQFAEDLIDLLHELSRAIDVSTAPLNAADQQLIAASWQQYVAARETRATDFFAQLGVAELRAIASRLDVPRQVIAAFRERRIIVASIPRRFLANLAAALGATEEALRSSLQIAPALECARSYKAEVKPQFESQISFEQSLTDAGVPPSRRSALLADEG
jgi:hypothetical protein